MRLVAALLVLLTHSFALVVGTADAEPLRSSLGMTFGNIAVDVFFITSGFLVTNSLMTRKDLVEFVIARALRIGPALLMMLVLVALAAGPLLSALSAREYFFNAGVYHFIAKNLLLIKGIDYELPGVFEGNPFGNVVNGSLWTMPYEIDMYGLLAIGWLVTRPFNRRHTDVLTFLIPAASAAFMILHVARHFMGVTEDNATHLLLMFFTGSSLCLLKSRVVLSARAAIVVGILLLASAVQKNAFFICYIASIAYLVLYLAYVPTGVLREFNRLGDYSFGVYIYAFPIQQALVHLYPRITVPEMIVCSLIATLAVAVTSWHVLERRALSLKGVAAEAVYARLGVGKPVDG